MTLNVACEAFTTVDAIVADCEKESVATIQDLIDAASDAICVLTGGVVSGRCTDTVRPRADCHGAVCGSGTCCCDYPRGIALRGPNPVVTTVTLDGAPFTDYVLIDNEILVRTDGENWPRHQDLTEATTEEGTLEIVYTFGLAIEPFATRACEELVTMLIKDPPQDTSGVHPRARSMNIAGVQISLEQIDAELKRRALMLPYLVRMMTIYAPNGPTPAVVYSPELEGWTLHTVS